jgi:hypothetical protein
MRSRRPLDASSIKSTSQYYSYFAACLVRRELVAWAEPFTECCGMGIVTTAAQACYIPDSCGRHVHPGQSDFAPLLGKLLNRSRVCVPLSLTEDQNQINDLRGDKRCDRLPLDAIIWLSICFVPIPNASCSSASDEYRYRTATATCFCAQPDIDKRPLDSPRSNPNF